jgi:hypothetical protein
VVAPLLMFLLYVVGIQYESGAWLRTCLMPLVAVAALLDVFLNYTVFYLYTGFDWPEKGEYTFSQRMPRLIDKGGWVGRLCLILAIALNALAPVEHINIPE